MAKFSTTGDKDYIVMGTAVKYFGISRKTGSDFTLEKGDTLTLDCGVRLKMMFKTDFKSNRSVFDKNMIIVAKVTPDSTPLPDCLIERRCTDIKVFITGDNMKMSSQEAFKAINSYTNYYAKLTKAEREALVYGIAAGASGTITVVKGVATVIDWITPGGPAFPLFGLAATALSGCVTAAAADKHLDAVNDARAYAGKLQQALTIIQMLAAMSNCFDDPNPVIVNPIVSTYWETVGKHYDAIGDGLATISNLLFSSSRLPGWGN